MGLVRVGGAQYPVMFFRHSQQHGVIFISQCGACFKAITFFRKSLRRRTAYLDGNLPFVIVEGIGDMVLCSDSVVNNSHIAGYLGLILYGLKVCVE